MGLALGASMALHGGALLALHGLPDGFGGGLRSDTLQVRLRALPEAAVPPRREVTRTGVAGHGSPTTPMYYPLRDLDERPQVRVHVEPAFPSGVHEGERRVAIELYIGLDGTVERVALLSSGPHGPFEDAAVRAFSAARFTPGRKAGLAVRSRMALEVMFGEPVPIAPERAAAFLAPR